jgi:peptidoglycan/xylan/chitin deacetylase (PgdA/CDA1 family)
MSSARPAIEAPDGKPLICHVVVNVEHWPFDQPMPRALFQKPPGMGQPRGPDIPNFCWVEYGMRCGLPRLLSLFERRGIPVTAAMNASVIDVYPAAAEAVLRGGWQLMGHGVIQRSLEHEADEVGVIRASLDRLQQFCGRRIRSWLGPGLGETHDTPDHLAAAGVEFIYEWSLDDLPERMITREGTVYAMPYALELNDVTIFAIEKHESSVFHRRFRDTVKVFDAEVRTSPKVLTLALHPHIIAQPHRLPYLERTLDMLQRRSDVTFMTCDAIGDWYKSQVPC